MSKMVIELDLTREVPDHNALRALSIGLEAYSRKLTDKEAQERKRHEHALGPDKQWYPHFPSEEMVREIQSLQYGLQSHIEKFMRWDDMSEDERWPEPPPTEEWPKPQQAHAETERVDQTGQVIPVGDASGDVAVDQVQPHKS